MSRELFSLFPAEPVPDALGYMMALGISNAPVIDKDNSLVGMVALRDLLDDRQGYSVRERMTSPVVSIPATATIAEAGRLIGKSGYHHIVVVDGAGRPVGILSSLDVLRGLVGMPVTHDATSPHYDPATGVSWTDDYLLDLENLDKVFDGAGVFALVRGGVGVEEIVVWAEASNAVRRRLVDLLVRPEEQNLRLQRVLAFRELRFRAARVEDPSLRDRIATAMVSQVRDAATD